jgi:hypothetical protein
VVSTTQFLTHFIFINPVKMEKEKEMDGVV